MAAAIELFAVESPYAVRNLRERLAKRQTELVTELMYAKDWSDFQRRLGRVEALGTAIDICDEINEKERM